MNSNTPQSVLKHTSNSAVHAHTVQTSLMSTDLLRGQKNVAISRNGSTYKLQATRLGKLILTK